MSKSKKKTLYGVCRKGGWRVAYVFPTREKAEEYIKNKHGAYEIREIIQ